MTNEVLKPGDIVLAALPFNDPKGHEQEGKRPVVVVVIPQGTLRYPVVIVVPLTTQSGPWAKENPSLYQHLPAGSGGLSQASIALLDQIRALDVQRVNAYLGTLEPKIFTPIRNNLLQLFERA